MLLSTAWSFCDRLHSGDGDVWYLANQPLCFKVWIHNSSWWSTSVAAAVFTVSPIVLSPQTSWWPPFMLVALFTWSVVLGRFPVVPFSSFHCFVYLKGNLVLWKFSWIFPPNGTFLFFFNSQICPQFLYKKMNFLCCDFWRHLTAAMMAEYICKQLFYSKRPLVHQWFSVVKQ